MDGKPSAQDKDKQIVHDPIVQAIEKKRLEHGSVRQAVNKQIEGCAEAGPVVKGNLRDQENGQTHCAGPTYDPDP